MPESASAPGCRCRAAIGQMSRRELMGSSLALAAAPLCCSTYQAPVDAVDISSGVLKLRLDLVPQLRHRDSAVRVVDTEKGVNLIVVHGPNGGYAALDRSCTHGGAQVAYNRFNGTVQCSSWGHSEFALDGNVLGGSAKKPLRSYEARVAGRTLEIHLERQP